jgi:hypothetical protein
MINKPASLADLSIMPLHDLVDRGPRAVDLRSEVLADGTRVSN